MQRGTKLHLFVFYPPVIDCAFPTNEYTLVVCERPRTVSHLWPRTERSLHSLLNQLPNRAASPVSTNRLICCNMPFAIPQRSPSTFLAEDDADGRGAQELREVMVVE